jgi:hypothetical protein
LFLTKKSNANKHKGYGKQQDEERHENENYSVRQGGFVVMRSSTPDGL